MLTSPDICVASEITPEKPQLEDCATSDRLKWGLVPPNEVGRIAQHVRKGEQKRRRKGRGMVIKSINSVDNITK